MLCFPFDFYTWKLDVDRSYANSAVSSSTEAPSSAISSNGEDTRLSTRGKQRKHLKMITELILQKKTWVVKMIVVYLCRYASLYFCMCIDEADNELEVLEIIHHYVEILDRYFGSVS